MKRMKEGGGWKRVGCVPSRAFLNFCFLLVLVVVVVVVVCMPKRLVIPLSETFNFIIISSNKALSALVDSSVV